MRSFDLSGDVTITFDNGLTGQGRAEADLDYDVTDEGGTRLESSTIYGSVVRFKFTNLPSRVPVVNGLCSLVVPDWHVAIDKMAMALQYDPDNGYYHGTFEIDHIPDGIRHEYELADGGIERNLGPIILPSASDIESSGATLRGLGASGQGHVVTGSMSAQEVTLRLATAIGHVQEIHDFVAEFEQTEPSDYARAMLHGLLVEVDTLGNRIDDLLATPVIADQPGVAIALWARLNGR